MRAVIGQNLIRKLPAKDIDIRDTNLRGFYVRCRASGTHSYRVDCGQCGKLTLGRVGTLEPHEARQLAKAALGDVARGVDPVAARRRADSASLEDFLQKSYEPWALTHQKSGAETVQRLRVTFAAFLSKPLTDISAFGIERHRSERLKSGISPSTCNREINDLRAALGKALTWKLLPGGVHPLKDVKSKKIDSTRVTRFLSFEEEDRLRAALQSRDDLRRRERESANVWRRERGYDEWPKFGRFTDHLTPVVLVALNTGLRRGELLNLRWTDVDLMTARLTVRGDGTKSGQTRFVRLNSEALDVLKAWRGNAEPAAHVFPADDGGRMEDIKGGWLRVVRNAKVQSFRFHDLRHTFASRLVQNGIDLNRVRELLGHADLKMTLRYSHLRREDMDAAVESLVRKAR